MTHLSRRGLLATSAAAAIAGRTHSVAADNREPAVGRRVRFCLNTSTVRGQKLSIEEEIDLAAAAGYDGIEPWIRELETYRNAGKSLSDLKKRIADAGLQVESAIGFAPWIVDDEDQRRRGQEQMLRDMDLVRQIGGTRIAAPPVGMHEQNAAVLDLRMAAERYRRLLELGQEMGVTPQVEFWGPSKNLSRLSEAVFVAVEAGHPDACILPDIYHLFRGGSSFDGLRVVAGQAIHCIHFNDYPAEPPREQQNDSFRVYPGDGAAPWTTIVGALQSIGFSGAASLELFNRDYWNLDPKLVVDTGLQKMKALFSVT